MTGSVITDAAGSNDTSCDSITNLVRLAGSLLEGGQRFDAQQLLHRNLPLGNRRGDFALNETVEALPGQRTCLPGSSGAKLNHACG